MLIAYLRPTLDDPSCEIQYNALTQLGCDQYIREEHSSPKRRVQLEKMLEQLNEGDQVVVTKLFILADSTRHLAELLDVLHAKKATIKTTSDNINTSIYTYSLYDCVKLLLEFQQDISSENTRKGMDKAKQNGTNVGRPRKPDANLKKAIEMYHNQKYTLAQIKEETGISKTTLYRNLES